MPRDLHALAKEDTLQGMPQLTKSPDMVSDAEDDDNNFVEREAPMDADDEDRMIDSLSQRNEKRDELHPYTSTLSISDVESCTRLEEECFPPNERCTREKLPPIPTTDASAPVFSGAPDRKAVLLGHIVATKTTNPTVTDDDMKCPNPDEDAHPEADEIGHKEDGRTICIHSLAVLPQYQRRGLGRTLLEAYLQRMESHAVADRVALIAHEHLIPYYESFGFVNQGKSSATFGGGGWFDLVKELKPGENLML